MKKSRFGEDQIIGILKESDQKLDIVASKDVVSRIR